MVARRPLVMAGGNVSELPAADWLTSPGGWVDCSRMTTAAEINAAADAAPDGSTIWLGARPGSAPLIVNETLVIQPRQRWLGAGGRQMLTVVQCGPSMPAGDPVMAARGWVLNGTVADEPISVEGINIDINAMAGRHGLVVYNFWSHFEDLQVEGASGATANSIHVTDVTKGGTTSGNSHSENTFVRLRINGTVNGAGGFYAQSSNGFSNQDGHLKDSFFSGVSGMAVDIRRAAGWTVENNHFYGTGEDAITLQACYATKVIGNYVEDFGANNSTTGPSNGYYTGIGLVHLNGRASIVANNTISILQPIPWAGNRLTAVAVRAGSGQTTACTVITGNTVTFANNDATGVGCEAFRIGEGGDTGRLLSVRWAANQLFPRSLFAQPIFRHQSTVRVDSRDEAFWRNVSGSGTLTIDVPDAGYNVNLTMTGDTTLAVPTNGIDTHPIQVVALASGAQRILTFDAGLERLGGVNASYTVPSGKKLRISLRCSTIDGTTDWVVEAAGVTQ